MPAESDPALDELTLAVREIADRVRARHPQGERGQFAIPLVDLLPLVHARDAAEAKVAAIGTVNPRPPGLKNNLIQSWKRFLARILDWHVREQVEFNRAQMNALQATIEALNATNRSLETIAATLDKFHARADAIDQKIDDVRAEMKPLDDRARELADITLHWQEWRKEWERNLAINETQFLRSVADLQGGFQHRATLMEANFRDTLRGQHADYQGALARANEDIQKRLWADLERIRVEYETIIHSELRSVRQKAFAAAAQTQPQTPVPAEQHSYDFLRFADRYRGPETYVRESFQHYLPYVKDHAPVIDLGCGRGEMLELLRENQIESQGIDADAESIAICQSKSLNVEKADIFAWLNNQPESSLGAIFCAQVIEHLPPLELPTFIRLCTTRLRKGGVLILETPNPECLAIFATHFYMDPTHQHPVPPTLTLFHMEEAGLGRLECKRLTPAADSMPALKSLPEDFRNAFFGALDYAAIGYKL